MPNTSPNNIFYPDNSTAVDDLAGLFASLATSVEAAIASVRSDLAPVAISDTGWTLTGITAATGWTGIADSSGVTGATVTGGMRKVGSHVELRFRATRSGAALTANSQGNIGDTLVATINTTAFRPAGTVYATFDFGPGLGTGGCRVQSNGQVYIVDAYPTAHINTGNTIQICANYFTG